MTTQQASAVRKSTVLGRKLGGELLKLRVAQGLTQPQAAKHLTATQTKVAKIERGAVPVRDPDLHALCDLYGLERVGPARDRLLALAKADRERRRAKGWWEEYTDLGDLLEYIQLEAGASRIRTFQNQLVPGLLQTPEYARAVVVADDVWEDPDEVDRFVSARIDRQARLTEDKPLELWAVLSEAVLRQQVGGPTVMRGQLERLVEASTMPNVKLQVWPFEAAAHASMSGPFVIVGFEEPAALDVIHVETAGSRLWLEREDDANRHRGLFDSVRRQALSPDDTRARLASFIKEYR
ncbi:helix-turn-helix domain-containing protein [Streptomyces pinistramenti]|uniref:helix-turn-helix domain-containing protein n=1 Tax=Streptomyces pinistramenti TaxID=2884812 RepID=UPI001D08709A|nr:helix-turn-helix transcriptional regulator [Streptomyces pinistramenti]MCB5908639.1 helix-turn-helix domain-containing protein [Streptomyces pinistramenti]